MIRRYFLIAALALLSAPLRAERIFPEPVEDPVLTIWAHGQEHRLDRAALATLPVHRFTTSTIWTDGQQDFAGVRVTDLLDLLGIHDGVLQLTAVNDYQVTVPVADFTADGAILAYERNGGPMTLREKGPIWLVYPYDSDPKFRTEIIYANSIWQLDRIAMTE